MRSAQIFHAPVSSTVPAVFALSMVLLLSGCMTGMAPSGGGGLAPGLTARIDSPSSQMDRGAALSLVNAYRATRGTSALLADPALDAQAAQVASQYARSGTPPSVPQGARAMRLSAGYETFAETFSGWRNSPADADVLALSSARRAGLAVVYDQTSAYGTHWVLVLGE
ncbi:CAP domain-containing protein [Pelagibacterium lentulum]|nr:CAP domain-containing protein [Pelagibacterium lentulum]